MHSDTLPCSKQDGVMRTAEVLIADDDPASLAALEKAFRIQGYETIACTDGREAWAAINKNPYVSLVVLNWMLPQMDGHEICRRLRKQRPEVVSVLMVGGAFLREAWSAMGLESRYVLAKPLPKTGVERMIGRIAQDALG